MAQNIFSKHSQNFFMGIMLGIAGQIPGLTGSSMALGMGCYQRVTRLLCQLWLFVWRLLKGQYPERKDFPHLLISLLIGVVAGVAGGYWLSGYLNAGFNEFLWAIVFGAVLFVTFREILHLEAKKKSTWYALVSGVLLILAADLAKPLSGSINSITPFCCGLMTAVVLFVPGISVTGLLLYLGCYSSLFAESHFGAHHFASGIFYLGLTIGLIIISLTADMFFKLWPNTFRAFLYGCLLMSAKTLWPWKDPIYKLDHYGNFMIGSHGQRIVSGYQGYFPETMSIETFFILVSIILGGVTVALIFRNQKKTMEL